MLLLIAGLILFLGVHSVSIVAPAWRDGVAERLGTGWQLLYSLVAAVGLLLVILGYGQARLSPTVVYVTPAGTKHLMYLLMLPVFPLLLATYLPGRINTTLKHPMLVAVKLWAFSHLLVNGMLADIILFGSFLTWAVIDRISFKHRIARATPAAPPGRYNDVLAVTVGLALYVLTLLWAHKLLIGISPL